MLSKAELERAAALTEAAGCWLVMDNTYDHFTYDGAEHACVGGRNVINIFSFSKAYGMMGWRVGYICYPDASMHATLGSQLLKVQVCIYMYTLVLLHTCIAVPHVDTCSPGLYSALCQCMAQFARMGAGFDAHLLNVLKQQDKGGACKPYESITMVCCAGHDSYLPHAAVAAGCRGGLERRERLGD